MSQPLLLLFNVPPTPITTTRLTRTCLRQTGSILRHCGRERAPRPDPRTVLVENDGDGNKSEGNEAEERARPVDAERSEHVRGEEGEDGAGEGAKESVGCDGGGGAFEAVSSRALRCLGGRSYLQHEIRIDEVIERLQEDCEQAETRQEARERGNDPMRLRLVP